jgi:hypothetical protein
VTQSRRNKRSSKRKLDQIKIRLANTGAGQADVLKPSVRDYHTGDRWVLLQVCRLAIPMAKAVRSCMRDKEVMLDGCWWWVIVGGGVVMKVEGSVQSPPPVTWVG